MVAISSVALVLSAGMAYIYLKRRESRNNTSRGDYANVPAQEAPAHEAPPPAQEAPTPAPLGAASSAVAAANALGPIVVPLKLKASEGVEFALGGDMA